MIRERNGACGTRELYGKATCKGELIVDVILRAEMRVLLQRVSSAAVRVNDKEVARIGRGAVILLGIGQGDGELQAQYLVEKMANLRIFEDAEGKMNLSLLDIGGTALVVSQFTLYADASKGRRPSFVGAAPPELAEPLVARFAELLAAQGISTQTGQFAAHMLVEINNDGPVTIWLER